MIKNLFYRSISRSVLQPWFRLQRGITLGVRAAVIDDQRRVLLVRHTYAPGWLLPGGGVERGETVFNAVKRELKEESGIIPTGRLFCEFTAPNVVDPETGINPCTNTTGCPAQ